MVRARPAVVQAGRLLRDPHPRVLRRQRRRLGRFPRADRQARLPRVARCRLPLAAADVRVAPARRRLRHLELLLPAPRLRVGGRLSRVRRAGAPARHAGHRRPRHEPHLGRPSVVRGVAGGSRQRQGRLVRVVGDGRALSRGARHLHRLGALQLDARPAPRRVLLAPLLPPPARPQLRQPGSAGGDARGTALLARPRYRRLPARRRALPLRTGRDVRREPARVARVPEARPRRGGRALPRPAVARRGEPVAGGRRRLLRRRRRVPDVFPLPGHAADVHGAASRGRDADLRDPRPDAEDPRQLPVGPLPPQPRRADPRDGHRRRAGLHVRGVRERPADEAQPRDPPLPDAGRDEGELLHAILFSLPGSPVLYYGDEIGMGDNVYLGDRDGVRTPMQWSGDRNAGFSRADWAQLYLQPLMDPLYGFQAVNVEAQLRTPNSLLRWMQRFIALRKEHPVFGLGTYEPLPAENTRIFAHIRKWEEDVVLCVHNLARSAQAVQLDLKDYAGMVPVEMLGRTAFPPIGELPYLLTLAPRGFFWFQLRQREQVE